MTHSTDNWLCLDFETDTSHGDYGHPVHKDNGLLLACWSLGPGHPFQDAGNHVRYQWGDEYSMDALLSAIDAAELLVAHNAKYELGWLRRCGLDLGTVEVFDTKIAEYVLMGNLASGDDKGNFPRSTSLNDCCVRRGWPAKDPVVDQWISDGINPVRIPRWMLLGRCKYDVLMTARLFLNQRLVLAKTGRRGVQYTRCKLTPMLAELEFAGMKLDANKVASAHTAYTKRLAELEVEFEEFTGNINWRSPKQIAEYLYNPVKPKEGELAGLGFAEVKDHRGNPLRTKTGAKATGKKQLGDNFEKLAVKTAKQRKFIELRTELGKVGNALSKNLDFFKGVCDEQDGVFNAVFHQTRTATHRLSSSGMPTKFEAYDRPKSVQFQNLPNVFKPLFTARRDGWVIAEADGSQLEFRVAAQLSKDPQMIADILNPDFDAHVTSASEMHQIPYNELLERYRAGDKEAALLRKKAKVDTFGPLYGKSTGSPEVMRWVNAFRDRYAGFYDWSEENVHVVLEDKVLVTPWGLRYYWPYAAMSKQSGYINVTTMVYNYPVQAFATAEIIPIAIRSFWDALRETGESGIVPINTVHDSLICEVSEDKIEAFKTLAISAFADKVYSYLSNVYNYDFDLVPLGVGFSWGSHWAGPENTEQEFNVYRDGRIERMGG